MKVGIWLPNNFLPEHGGSYSYINKLVNNIDLYKFDESINICFITTRVTSFDLNNPRDLSDKLYHHSINKINSEEKVKNAYKYYIDNLNDNSRISTLTKLIEDYEYFQNRWKNNY